MNTSPKNNIEQGSGLLAHPEQVSGHAAGTGHKANAYDRITERVIELLNQGTIPWQKPWNVKRGFPRNLVTGKGYRGINVFLLHAMQFESPLWLTFKQAQDLGAKVRKGEKACPVVFWKQLEVEDKETGELEKVPLLKIYSVFNVAQIDGLKALPAPEVEPVLKKPAEIFENMPQRPSVKYGMAQAFYSVSHDFIGMPNRERFASDDEFYCTLYHETVHCSGHEKRLNRPGLTDRSGFGSEQYSKEELVAEMGAAFLCGQAGIAERTLNNSAAYIQNWLKQLQNDKKLIVQAAAQAQKAADFILGVKHEVAPAERQGTATT